MIYLLSATGVVVYQSYCLCTGNDHVSVYVSPDTCEDNYHTHHVHLKGGEEVPSSGDQCHECTSHTNNCGCDHVIMNYFKLKDEVVFDKGRTKTILPVVAIVPENTVNFLSAVVDVPDEVEIFDSEPPVAHSSLDFLITIHQLKIPHTA